jgi:hypothetical protein
MLVTNISFIDIGPSFNPLVVDTGVKESVLNKKINILNKKINILYKKINILNKKIYILNIILSFIYH